MHCLYKLLFVCMSEKKRSVTMKKDVVVLQRENPTATHAWIAWLGLDWHVQRMYLSGRGLADVSCLHNCRRFN